MRVHTRADLCLHLITQLSDALAYLESQHIVHGDIAARNCLLFANYQLKLTNVAMASERFQDHYHSVGDDRWPIRWMAPESFTTVSGILRVIFSPISSL